MSVVNKSLDYSKNEYVTPSYRLNRILPQSGGFQSATNLSVSGGEEVIMEIPSKVVNLSKSHLTFTLNVPATAADTRSYVFADNWAPIRTIELYTRGGLYLAQLQDIGNYTRMVNKAVTKFDSFVCRDEQSLLAPSRQASADVAGDGANAATINSRLDNSQANYPFNESKYFFVSGVAGAQTIYYKLFLNDLHHTILSLDKDLLFNEVVVLRLVFNSIPNITFRRATSGAGAVAAVGVVPTIAAFNLMLAVEQDPGVIASVTAKRNSPEGLSVLMDYVYYNKINLTGAGTQAITLRFNRSHGSKLKRIYWSPFPTNATNNTAFDNSNINGSKITSFYSLTDNMRDQEIELRCATANLEDYLFMRNKINGSCLLNANIYQYNWVWIADWNEPDAPVDLAKQPIDLDNCSFGLPLDVEHKFDIFSIATGDLSHYCYSVAEKMLIMNQAGILVM